MTTQSNYLKDKLLNATLRNTTYTSPSAVYIALHTADPTDAALSTEASGVNYQRQAATFSAPQAASGGGRKVQLSSTVLFPVTGAGGWGTVTHWSLWDAQSGGNMLFHDNIRKPDGSTVSKVMNANTQFKMPSGSSCEVKFSGGISDSLADSLLNHILRNTAYTSLSTIYIALYKTDPTGGDTGTEIVSTGGTLYARQTITFNAPIDDGAGGHKCQNAAEVDFPVAGADWTGSGDPIAYWGIRTASTSGSLMYYGQFDASAPIYISDQFIIDTQGLEISQR